MIFQALEHLQPQWPLRPQQPQWPQWPQQPHFIKKITRSAALMILGTKMTNTGPFLWNGWSKIQIFTDFSIFSAGGCWGQPMLFFWKLICETQISKPPEATRHHNSTKLLILVPLRANLLCTLHYETPCKWEGWCQCLRYKFVTKLWTTSSNGFIANTIQLFTLLAPQTWAFLSPTWNSSI